MYTKIETRENYTPERKKLILPATAKKRITQKFGSSVKSRIQDIIDRKKRSKEGFLHGVLAKGENNSELRSMRESSKKLFRTGKADKTSLWIGGLLSDWAKTGVVVIVVVVAAIFLYRKYFGRGKQNEYNFRDYSAI